MKENLARQAELALKLRGDYGSVDCINTDVEVLPQDPENVMPGEAAQDYGEALHQHDGDPAAGGRDAAYGDPYLAPAALAAAGPAPAPAPAGPPAPRPPAPAVPAQSMPALSIHTHAEPSIDAAFKAAAQSRYAELRALGPVHRARILNGVPCWVVVDFELAKEALTHPALLKDNNAQTKICFRLPDATVAAAAARRLDPNDPGLPEQIRTLGVGEALVSLGGNAPRPLIMTQAYRDAAKLGRPAENDD